MLMLMVFLAGLPLTLSSTINNAGHPPSVPPRTSDSLGQTKTSDSFTFSHRPHHEHHQILTNKGSIMENSYAHFQKLLLREKRSLIDSSDINQKQQAKSETSFQAPDRKQDSLANSGLRQQDGLGTARGNNLDSSAAPQNIAAKPHSKAGWRMEACLDTCVTKLDKGEW